MTIMSKEVKTPVGVVTITTSAKREGPAPHFLVVEYTARVEVNGLVYQYNMGIPVATLADANSRVFRDVERDLLRGLAMQLVKETK